jgi:hypothetical protein
MKGTVLIYQPGKEEPEISEVTKSPTLEFLQGAVGGFIEAVPLFNTIEYKDERRRCVVYCNEEGKLKGLPYNSRATFLWNEALPPPGLIDKGGAMADVLVGPIVVLLGDAAFMQSL